MKLSNFCLHALAGACALHSFASASAAQGPPAPERIVVADRGSGELSVIDTASDAVVATIALPGALAPEPMYVTYSGPQDRLFAGDRANDAVVVLDASDFSVEAVVPAGDGVFHMWNDPAGKLLWVNNDVDKSATLIDPATLAVIATVPMPADLVAAGWKPHDVVLSPSGRRAYVSMIRPEGPRDWIVMFDTASLEEVNRAAVGKDPHVALHRSNHLLFVPTMASNRVTVLDRTTLLPLAHLAVPGAHGAMLSPVGDFFYTTNLPGGGAAGIFTIDAQTLEQVGDPVDVSFPVPHNIALTSDGSKMYVTHSGPSADKVSVFDVSSLDGRPSPRGAITVGLNPFGIVLIP